MKENQINDKDFLQFLQENKDKETQIQIRLFDNKNHRLACKMLTIKELMLIEAIVNPEWHYLKKGEK